MFLEHFLIEEVNETNVYLIACRQTRKAALIDAGGFDPLVVDTVKIQGFDLERILITHDHYDHTTGLPGYIDAFPDCHLGGGAATVGGLSAHLFEDGETFELGTLSVKALAVHGHTPDSMGFYFHRAVGEGLSAISVLFSGDILFSGSVGGTPGAALHQDEIKGIRSKFFTLPDETNIYTGHGPATTVGVEKQYNPFF